MRGTPRQTNKALSAPILLLGAERNLVILTCFFWIWAFIGVFPHWPIVLIAMIFLMNLYVLRLAAKRDPQGVAVFRTNSRFLVQKRFYFARGFAGNLQKVRKLSTVPTKLFSKI